MIVTYTPQGTDQPRTWSFDPEDVPESMAEVIERRFGGDNPTYEAWQQGILHGSARARRVLLWHLLQREHPTIRYEDVDPTRKQLTVQFTRTELYAMKDRVQATRKMPAEQREQILLALDIQLERAPDDLEPEGKAPSAT